MARRQVCTVHAHPRRNTECLPWRSEPPVTFGRLAPPTPTPLQSSPQSICADDAAQVSLIGPSSVRPTNAGDAMSRSVRRQPSAAAEFEMFRRAGCPAPRAPNCPGEPTSEQHTTNRMVEHFEDRRLFFDPYDDRGRQGAPPERSRRRRRRRRDNRAGKTPPGQGDAIVTSDRLARKLYPSVDLQRGGCQPRRAARPPRIHPGVRAGRRAGMDGATSRV